MKALQQKQSSVPMVALLVLAAAVLAGLCVQHFRYNGNPGTEDKIKKSAYEYVQQTHPDIADRVELNIHTVTYNKDGSEAYPHPYWTVCFFESMGDIVFDLVYDSQGNLVSDGYETWYLTGGEAYRGRSDEYGEYLKTVTLSHKSKMLECSGLFYKTMDYARITNQEFYAYSVKADYTGPYLTPGEKRDFNQVAQAEGYINIAMWYDYGDINRFADMVTDAISQLDEKVINWHSARFAWWCGEEKNVDAYYILHITHDQRHRPDLRQYIADNTEFTDMRK